MPKTYQNRSESIARKDPVKDPTARLNRPARQTGSLGASRSAKWCDRAPTGDQDDEDEAESIRDQPHRPERDSGTLLLIGRTLARRLLLRIARDRTTIPRGMSRFLEIGYHVLHPLLDVREGNPVEIVDVHRFPGVGLGHEGPFSAKPAWIAKQVVHGALGRRCRIPDNRFQVTTRANREK